MKTFEVSTSPQVPSTGCPWEKTGVSAKHLTLWNSKNYQLLSDQSRPCLLLYSLYHSHAKLHTGVWGMSTHYASHFDSWAPKVHLQGHMKTSPQILVTITCSLDTALSLRPDAKSHHPTQAPYNPHLSLPTLRHLQKPLLSFSLDQNPSCQVIPSRIGPWIHQITKTSMNANFCSHGTPAIYE